MKSEVSVSRERTFRSRLTWAMTLLCVAALASAETAVYVLTRSALRVNLDSALVSIAQSEAASMLDGPSGMPHVHPTKPLPARPGSRSGYETFVVVRDAGGSEVARTDNVEPRMPFASVHALEGRALAGEVVFADLDHFRVVYYPIAAAGSRYVAVIAVSTDPLQRSSKSLLLVLTVSLAAGSVAVLWGARRIARRLTAPLDRISAAARAVDPSSLGGRIPEVATDRELRDVIDVLNEMLSRLEAAFGAQRRFAADASHELRTPLANMRGTVEVALRRPPRDARDPAS
jgi:signal transduction histidine kinase